MKLETLAKGMPCYLRLPGVCNGNPETTVFCHIRRGGIAGTGIKPPPVCGVPMCSNCHDAYDGRSGTHGYTRTELDAEMCRAQNQWLAYLWANEYIIPGGLAA